MLRRATDRRHRDVRQRRIRRRAVPVALAGFNANDTAGDNYALVGFGNANEIMWRLRFPIHTLNQPSNRPCAKVIHGFLP
jgi:hypothetical protein